MIFTFLPFVILYISHNPRRTAGRSVCLSRHGPPGPVAYVPHAPLSFSSSGMRMVSGCPGSPGDAVTIAKAGKDYRAFHEKAWFPGRRARTRCLYFWGSSMLTLSLPHVLLIVQKPDGSHCMSRSSPLTYILTSPFTHRYPELQSELCRAVAFHRKVK